MHDELVIDKATGEILTATEAIHIFYGVKKHSALDSWLDDYELTGEEAKTFIPAPDFAKVLAL